MLGQRNTRDSEMHTLYLESDRDLKCFTYLPSS